MMPESISASISVKMLPFALKVRSASNAFHTIPPTSPCNFSCSFFICRSSETEFRNGTLMIRSQNAVSDTPLYSCNGKLLIRSNLAAFSKFIGSLYNGRPNIVSSPVSCLIPATVFALSGTSGTSGQTKSNFPGRAPVTRSLPIAFTSVIVKEESSPNIHFKIFAD